MKIVLTGGGTGGHFYPLIAVAQELHKQAKEQKLLNIKIYYMAPEPYNKSLLFENSITFVMVPAGKRRMYFSVLNFIDFFKTGFGIIIAIWKVFRIFPDVIFSKGGYVSFPILIAARFFGIPVVIHESDSVPGRVNRWAGKFAKKIAISFPEAMDYFKKEKVAFTGNPIRRELMTLQKTGAYEFLKLEYDVPVILVLGGSQGAQIINEIILSSLSRLVDRYQIIHQTGVLNFNEISETAKIVLNNNPHRERYKLFGYLNTLALRMSVGVSNLIISRAGSVIFEIAVWKIPSILIPITNSNEDHQRKNAFAYARSGAATVIEENNFNVDILVREIDRIMTNPQIQEKMMKGAESFAKINSAELIANEVIKIALTHEK